MVLNSGWTATGDEEAMLGGTGALQREKMYTDNALLEPVIFVNGSLTGMTWVMITWIQGAPNDFVYTGNVQTFRADKTGYYRIELRGAGGQSRWDYNQPGGAGAYTRGKIYLTAGQELYVYVGQSTTAGGATSFNGSPSSAGGRP
jgi:hypothetical protein